MTTTSLIPTSETYPTLAAIERAVAVLWCEILDTDKSIGATDSFFDLGGDSMAMVMLEYRTQETFGVQLSPAALLDAATLRDFSILIATALGLSQGLQVEMSASLPSS